MITPIRSHLLYSRFSHPRLQAHRNRCECKKKWWPTWIGILALCALFGCESPHHDHNTAMARVKPRSILVIPPLNNSIEVYAPYVFLSTITKPLAEKGFYVYPVAVIDHFLKENGLPTPAEMNQVPLDALRKNIGADAVLYTNIEQWGQKFEIISSRTVVSAQMRLVDTRSGELLWNAHAYAQQQSNDSGNGWAGAIIGAVITQILSNAQDLTPELSRQANEAAIRHTQSGLPNGPYRQTDPFVSTERVSAEQTADPTQ